MYSALWILLLLGISSVFSEISVVTDRQDDAIFVSNGLDDHFPPEVPEHPDFPPFVSHPPPEHPDFPPFVSHPPPEHPHFPPFIPHPPPESPHSPPPKPVFPPPRPVHPPPRPVHPPPKPVSPPPTSPPPPHHLPPAVLANLTVDKSGKLTPKFDPKVFNYSTSVSHKVKKITITAHIPQKEEKDEYTITVNSIPLKSGVPSPQLSIGKAGKDVLFEIDVSALEHEPTTYYLLVHRGKSKWDTFGKKFLLVLAIILVIAVLLFLAYGCYVFFKTGRMPAIWPFRRSDDYSALGGGAGTSTTGP